ncbi:MAG: NAD-dependent epimerase/dehydratase family protein [Candidatus Limnocylindrales bacterium]
MASADDRIAVVTGGCGFIGSHLVRRLADEGRTVRVLDDLSSGDVRRLPPGVDFREGDVADPSAVRLAVAGAGVVFHLAAVASVQRSTERWLDSHLTNSSGSVTVMEAIRDVAPDAAFVFASSAAVYGDVPLGPGDMIGEAVPARPLTPYGIDKLGTEMHAHAAGSLFGLRSMGLRFFNVFGAGQDPASPYSGVISRFLAEARSGGPITIFGDGLQTRDFVYVDEVVRALLMAEPAASTEGAALNICTGVATTVWGLAGAVKGALGMEVAVVHGEPRPGDIRRSVGDPSAADRLLGWRPQIGLPEGLARLAAEESA